MLVVAFIIMSQNAFALGDLEILWDTENSFKQVFEPFIVYFGAG